MSPYIFISYRREDTRWIARSLHRYFSQVFGEDRVFMDRVEIRFGDDWRGKIEQGLARATILLPLIGTRWLELKDDESQRRRIDNDEDWVRAEIRAALNAGTKIFPIYVDGARPIQDPKHLPPDIAKLSRYQYVEMSETSWEGSLSLLVRELARTAGLAVCDLSVPLPERRKQVHPLTRQELDDFRIHNPAWRVTTSESLTTNGLATFLRTELYREYRFSTFPLATRFMAETSAAIDQLQHHPRWENMWRTVRVWLSTWDIEFQPSEYDLKLAQLLDERFGSFDGEVHDGTPSTSSKAP